MGATFSRRTAWDREESSWARAIRERRARGERTLDLTRSNPGACGLGMAEAEVLGPLGSEASLRYEPDPLGAPRAREAVARYYGEHGAEVDAARVLMTASTSESYSYLFHLLCDAGDEVLVARPSYPLFDYLGDLADVRLRPYGLFYDFGWWIDLAELEAAIGPRTRAIVVVHPNNPTGHATSAPERRRLESVCAERGLALIVDEVFLDFALGEEDAALRSFAAGQSEALCFVLSGLSKVVALPQMKVGWVAVRGPETQAREAMERLEVIADTFLSVNTPAQAAMPQWMALRAAVQAPIRARLRANIAAMQAAGLDVLRLDGGWSAVVRMPVGGSGDATAGRLLERGVLVHPGEFFGMAERSRVVVSLLTPEAEMREGAAVMAAVAREDVQG